MYRPENPPPEYDDGWFYRELHKLEQAQYSIEFVHLVEQTNPPDKPRTGMTALADGTNWDPGSGQGVYTYYAGAWHKLG